MYEKYIKRALDLLLSFMAFYVLLPFMIVIAILIKLESPGPVLFKQKRIGRKGSHFMLYKFRTMRIDAPKDTPTHLLENPESYITKTGKFLRRASMDELPNLINILHGEMSLIGPRPALWNQYDLAAERDKYRANDIYPGLTGLAQISGRDELPIIQKAELDGKYAQNLSLCMDLRCLLGTIDVVLRQRGIREGVNSNETYSNQR